MDLVHSLDVAMTRRAAHPGSDVNAVIEVDELRKLVNPDPVKRLTAPGALADERQARTLPRNELVTIHTDLRLRDRSERRDFDLGVAVTTIDLQLTGMKAMAEGHWLPGHVAGVRETRGEVVPGRKQRAGHRQEQNEAGVERNPVRPRRKDLRHGPLREPKRLSRPGSHEGAITTCAFPGRPRRPTRRSPGESSGGRES